VPLGTEHADSQT